MIFLTSRPPIVWRFLFIYKTEKGMLMKILKLLVCMGLIFAPIVGAHAAVCQSLENCTARLLSGYCCCPTGSTGTGYKCPDGWTGANPLVSSTCSRAAETGSDTKGTYEKTYGTCTSSSYTYDCYQTMASSGADGSCFCTATQQ